MSSPSNLPPQLSILLRHPKSHLIGLFFLIFLLFASCSSRQISLPITPFPSTDNRYDFVKWFRLNFYKIYLLQRKKNDGWDRLRIFIRRFPQKAAWTYFANKRHIEKRRQLGLKLGDIELIYLTMNYMIKEVIPSEIKKQEKNEQ